MSIAGLKLRCADPAALRPFYLRTFDALGTEGGCVLGREHIAFAPAADPRAETFLSNETGFQHFAIVVADMSQAYARLCAAPDWRPISLGGPERLPATSGGAAAFKFRDPEGHPLELLQFGANAVPPLWRARFAAEPQRVFFGVDHTGIAVTDVEASLRFWASAGFVATHRQTNSGQKQARLDGFADRDDAEVEIVSLSPPDGARPGVELLGYRSPTMVARPAADNSTAATAVIVAGAAASRDPDGHRVEPDYITS